MVIEDLLAGSIARTALRSKLSARRLEVCVLEGARPALDLAFDLALRQPRGSGHVLVLATAERGVERERAGELPRR